MTENSETRPKNKSLSQSKQTVPMTGNPKNSKSGSQNTIEINKAERHEEPEVGAKAEAPCKLPWPLWPGGLREGGKISSWISHELCSFAFLKGSLAWEEKWRKCNDYTTLQKLDRTKYPFKKGINITGLDELSEGKIDRIATEDDWIRLKANGSFIYYVDIKVLSSESAGKITTQSLLGIFGSQFFPGKGKFNTGIGKKPKDSAKQVQVGSCKETFIFPWDQKTLTMQKGNVSLRLQGVHLYNAVHSVCVRQDLAQSL